MDDSAWFLAEEVTLTIQCNLQVSKPFSECTAPRLNCVVLIHPWTKLDLYLGGWVGTEIIWCCSCQNLESSDDGSMGMLAVIDAEWSVTTKYRGVFDLMNINELSLSLPATVGRLLSCRVGAGQLLTFDINPSVVTRTFNVCWFVC